MTQPALPGSERLAELLRTHPVLAGDAALLVLAGEQGLYRLRGGVIQAAFPVSTSRYGLGCREGSRCTPTGLHCIADKIGSGEAEREIFVGRQPQGRLAPIQPNAAPGATDLITSRILWLCGLEPGRNSGQDASGTCCDSYARYIYIHGTAEEGAIGRPASIGCIRMRNADVISLFDEVDLGEALLIAE